MLTYEHLKPEIDKLPEGTCAVYSLALALQKPLDKVYSTMLERGWYEPGEGTDYDKIMVALDYFKASYRETLLPPTKRDTFQDLHRVTRDLLRTLETGTHLVTVYIHAFALVYNVPFGGHIFVMRDGKPDDWIKPVWKPLIEEGMCRAISVMTLT